VAEQADPPAATEIEALAAEDLESGLGSRHVAKAAYVARAPAVKFSGVAAR
jgi:hypothetical protein